MRITYWIVCKDCSHSFLSKTDKTECENCGSKNLNISKEDDE